MTGTAERVGRFAPNSAEWHAARAAGIGASEIAAVLGLSPWESKFSLWHRKKGLIDGHIDKEILWWGRELEQPIARRFLLEHPNYRVARTGTWRSKDRMWQLCNPDRFAYCPHRAPVEIKWSPYSDGWGTGIEDIPVYYRCQVLWQVDVLGAEFGFLAALVGAEYREYVIEHDADDIAIMRDAGARFMESLANDERPDIIADGHTYQALRELHRDIERIDVEICAEMAREYRSALATAKAAEAQKQLAKSRVLDAMGKARRAVCDGVPLATRVASRHGIQLRPASESTSIRKVKEVA
jgi:putative phage-type endonuclease